MNQSNRSNQSKRGVTIVELIIVVVVIGILAGLTTVGFRLGQQKARDTEREARVTALVESFEKYYEKNGEYPSIRSVVNSYADNTADTVANRLDISKELLYLPKTPTTARSAISSSWNLANDYVGYYGERPSNISSCQTTLAGGCDKFRLEYALEANNGTHKIIYSRYGN